MKGNHLYITPKMLLEAMYQSGVPSVEAVSDAIDNKYYVRIRYDDEQEDSFRFTKSRLIVPFALGRKNGKLLLRAFPIQGSTRRGLGKWKTYRVDRITSWGPMRRKHFNLEPRDLGYDTQAYNPTSDGSMDSIITQVDFSRTEPLTDLEKMQMLHQNRMNGPTVGKGVGNGNFRQRKRTSVAGMKRNAIEKNIEQSDSQKTFDAWEAAEAEARAQQQSGPIPTDMVSHLEYHETEDNNEAPIGGYENPMAKSNSDNNQQSEKDWEYAEFFKKSHNTDYEEDEVDGEDYQSDDEKNVK